MTEKTKELAELSVRVVILGIVLSVVMGAANVYLGLKAGMTVSASIPAAVIAMLILRGLFRNGTILEANQVQTAASAGESLAAGIIFTMPALILIGVWKEFDVVLTTVIAFTGGLLGILFMIPMRRVFVTSVREERKFPEGVACAAVLEDGEGDETGPSDAFSVVKGAGLGALFKLLMTFVGLMKGTLEGAMAAGGRIFYFGADISPALIAVGFIVRLNVALLIFIGGGLAWLVGLPLLGLPEGAGEDALDNAWSLWSTQIRYVGVGAMVVGGLDSIYKVRGGLVQAIAELKKKASPDAEDNPLDRDIPSIAIIALSVLATALVAGTYYMLTGHIGITLATTVIMLVMSFFFTAVASYIVGLVGNSNSPVSGMTITAVLFTGGMLYIFGFSGTEGMVATLGVAAIVCCAACTSGDVCNDLKTGQLVGAKPYRQQIMQVAGVAAAALVMAPVLQLLHNHTEGGIGGRELSAPQAGLFASLARGFFGDGQLPWNMVAWGAGVGVIILIVDSLLKKKGSSFRAHLMPIAVGMYLPFGLATPILVGGLLAHFFSKGINDDKAVDNRLQRGVLFSSGIIAGESLMGVGIAGLAALAIPRLSLGIDGGIVTGITFVGALLAVYLFYREGKPRT
jgi:putative OPT family oligopeptide transporter